jgi:hypothetical protein
MRSLALALLLALSAAACGSLSGAGSGVGPALASASTAPGASATISASAVASATAIVTGTIFPIGTGTLPPPVPTPTPSPTPSPAPGGLTQAQLKYKVVAQFGRLSFCDPDFYPVARQDEQAAADQRFPEIQRDAPTFSAILSHLGIAPASTYTSAQRLAIYREWKMLNALRLEPQGTSFHFNAIFEAGRSDQQGTRVDGTIDAFGQITVASRTPSGPSMSAAFASPRRSNSSARRRSRRRTRSYVSRWMTAASCSSRRDIRPRTDGASEISRSATSWMVAGS